MTDESRPDSGPDPGPPSASAQASELRLVVLLWHVDPAEGAGPINACEQAALAMALQLRTALAGSLGALILGGDRTSATARSVLQAGCDRVLCIGNTAEIDQVLIDLDYLSVATAIGAALARMGCDILLCPDRSRDELQGVLGPTVAELLDVPHLTGVVDIHPATPGEKPGHAGSLSLVATYRGDQECHHFRCTPPVVLCVPAFAPAQPASSQAIRLAEACRISADSAAADTIEHMSFGDFGVELGESNEPFGAPARSLRRRPVMAGAAEIVAHLIEDRLLP